MPTIALIAIVAGVVIGSKLLVENMLGFSLEPWARAWVADAGPRAPPSSSACSPSTSSCPFPRASSWSSAAPPSALVGVAAGVRRIDRRRVARLRAGAHVTARRWRRGSSATSGDRSA